MSDTNGMEDMVQDFLTEAYDLLEDVDNKLVELERAPADSHLLNDIFRGFHTIKGGAGFLNADALVNVCHLTENLFDHLRTGQLSLTPSLMDVILGATRAVRHLFDAMAANAPPQAAPAELLRALQDALSTQAGEPAAGASDSGVPAVIGCAAPAIPEARWERLMEVAAGAASETARPAAADAAPPAHPLGRRDTDALTASIASPLVGGRRASEKLAVKDNAIRVDTDRLDQVLNLSGEIGLTKNRLTSLRADILAGRANADVLHALDQAVSQLDLLVSDLQNSVMKTRMQPIARLFQKYPRIARDLARQRDKEAELVLVGEQTEIDKTMVEELADPLLHLIRNAVDHGIESKAERVAAGKPEKGVVRLEARQEGDHIVIVVADDGRGMHAERIRVKAVEKRLISEDEANSLDEQQSLNLVFLPGFSTKDEISDVSRRGVGMDVVRTNIQRLSGTVEIRSEPGKGSAFVISLPLTLAILPVLLVRLGDQPLALPLSMVREILTIEPKEVKEVSGRQTLVVRGEVLPIIPLSQLLGWPQAHSHGYGVLMRCAERAFILSVDSFAGRDDAVIKSLDTFRPRGVVGVTTLSNGQIVLILEMKELLADFDERNRQPAAWLRMAA